MTGVCPPLARGLCLAAAPTFAVMAVLTAMTGASQADVICSSGHGAAASRMVLMYLLMSSFHLPPWLALASSRLHRTCGLARD